MPHMRLGKNRLRSHNGLLRSLDGADGLKTGFTCDSGFNIVASATRDGRRLVAVVLGDSSSAERNVRAASLLEYGFQKYGWCQLFNYQTVDNMPFAPTAAGVTSVRKASTPGAAIPRSKKARVSNRASASEPAQEVADAEEAGCVSTDRLQGASASVARQSAAPRAPQGSVRSERAHVAPTP